MKAKRLFEMTWEEVRALPPEKTVAILPVGAIEAHGPHLPLGTDVIIAEAMSEEAFRRLAQTRISSVVLPALCFAAAPFAAAFPGTLSSRQENVSGTLVDIARSLARHQFRTLALANAHLDPAHIASLDRAAAEIRAENLLCVVFPDITKKPWALRLTEEFKSGACHAGQYEGSVLMAVAPERVREEIRRALPANPASLSRAIREGKKSFEEAGGPRAYFGYPAQATAEEGRRTVEALGAMLEEAIIAALSSP